jgi:hypothetical protein
MQLNKIQESLVSRFDFDAMLNDLSIIDDCGLMGRKYQLEEFAEKAIKHIFDYEKEINIAVWSSYLCATKTYIDDEIVYSLESKLNKQSKIFTLYKKEIAK